MLAALVDIFLDIIMCKDQKENLQISDNIKLL
jgi:hypothetical protein